MKPHFVAAIAAIALASASLPARAEPAKLPLPTVNTPTPAETTLTPQQLDQLVAPVALYPDPVLAAILAASTYPAEIVEAHRFSTNPANNGLQGAALADGATAHDWDPSVVALLQFPPVLAMMDSDLEWTEHLGRAFMTQQTDVMNAVQCLRQQAENAGALKNGWPESVVNDGGNIAINPPSSQYVYLPTYDAACVYAPGPACDADDDELAWDDGIYLPYGFWPSGGFDWSRHQIRFHHRDAGRSHAGVAQGGNNGGDIWHHNAPRGFAHYVGAVAIPYRDAGNVGEFQYAPPAYQYTSHGNRATGYAGHISRPALPTHFGGAPAFRAPVTHAFVQRAMPAVVVEAVGRR